jgi:crotonobetainyl-CoA:carnitine CoA-transferase CaiB-like acyl-CoA transferase
VPGALEGMRVIDLTHHIVGPYSTKLMADYGADVVKIERPGTGDPSRRLGPFFNDVPDIEASGTFLHLNSNKRSVTLNLKNPTGREILLQLVSDSDVLVESFSPRVMPSLGLDYETLRAKNPNLVMASISNYGQSGPYRDYKASELTLFAMGGVMASTGLPDREPVKLAQTVLQFYAGMVASTAIAGAYLGAKFHGVGQRVDLSLHQIIATNQDRGLQTSAEYQYLGQIHPRTRGNRRNIVPNSAYPCADGYVQMFALNQTWQAVCTLIERPDLIENPHFTAPENFSGNPDVAREFDAIFLDWLAAHNKQEIMVRAQQVGYICGAANTMEGAFADLQLNSRGFFVEVDHPNAGRLRYPGAPVRMAETPWRAGRAPLLGEHTREILGSRLGYSEVDVEQLSDAEVV